MKKKNRRKGYSFVVGLLFLVSFIFIISLVILNVLSFKYFIFSVFGILFLDFIMYLFVLKSRVAKVFCGISLILILIYMILSFYLFKTSSFFSGLFGKYDIYTYKVLALEDSKIDNIEDLSDRTVGYVSNFIKDEVSVFSELSDKIEFKNKSYTSVDLMFDDLYKGDVDAILVLDSYFDLLISDFDVDVSLFNEIYSIEVYEEIDKTLEEVDVTRDSFNIFISGIDSYGEISGVSRSDVNMVVSVNPVSKKILLTSIPRDYYVSLHGLSGYKDKITHAGLYGIDVLSDTASDLLGIDIDYYIKVNFTSVIDIVDALKGVEVYSEYSFTSIDGIHYTKGYNKLDGKEALSFARERQAFASGDRQRVRNQQELLKAILKKCFSSDIIYKYSKLLDSLDNSFVTNIPNDKITDFIKMQLDDMESYEIISNSLSGSDSYNYTYTVSSSKLYVMEVDLESVNDAHDLIISVISGKDVE